MTSFNKYLAGWWRDPLSFLLVILAVKIFLLPYSLKAASFRTFDLQVSGKIIEIIDEDLNNDGLKDLLIIHIQGLVPQETRWLSLFWQRRNNSFSSSADQLLEMDREATVIDIGDVDNAEGKEIVYLTGNGVNYYRLLEDKYVPNETSLIKMETITIFPEKDYLPYLNFVRDINGDDRDDIAVFNFGELSLFLANPAYVFNKFYRMKIETEASFYTYDILSKDIDSTKIPAFSISYRFPQITTRDLNGDGRNDMIFLRENNLIAFIQKEDGSFPVIPQKKHFSIRTAEERREEFINMKIQVDDLDGDGLADVLITKQKVKGLTSMIARTIIFYNCQGTFNDTPEQVISTEGTASVSSIVRDINNDGKMDLILPTFRFGITSIIRYFLTQEIKVKFLIFLMQDDNRYPLRSDFERVVKFKIDLSGKSNLRVINIDGDFNGDGIRDLALGTEDNRLSIFTGLKNPRKGGKIFSSKADCNVEINTLACLTTTDLTGDKRSDMIFSYPRNSEMEGLIKVLVKSGEK